MLVMRDADLEALKNYEGDLNVREYARDELGVHIAARFNKLECLKHLHSLGADLNAKDASGKTAARIAAYFGNLDCLKYLIDAGADMYATANIAAYRGKLDCLKYILQKNRRNKNGKKKI